MFGTAGQWLITRAYQVGEAAALAPLDFSRLLLRRASPASSSSPRLPELTTWLGAAIVIGATLYTIRKNARGAGRNRRGLNGFAPLEIGISAATAFGPAVA